MGINRLDPGGNAASIPLGETWSPVRWIGLITIVGPGTLLLARLVRFTLHLSRAPRISHAPAWIMPHLVKVLFVLDAGIAIALCVSGVVLLRMDSE